MIRTMIKFMITTETKATDPYRRTHVGESSPSLWLPSPDSSSTLLAPRRNGWPGNKLADVIAA
ncbi:hypothetical protein EHS25_002100 [Saitozyma podzolica]|uniref:Uncharacterized protein n=1 Tax=Saitozyma podzolica TaxID=1890683 RepID=A0A427YEE9_9TREE|nr:hypothetical protein EHS25_002100 [Saitozyma podzolica]